MITFDNLSLIIGGVVLFLALLTPWINIFVRRPSVPYASDDASEDEPDNGSEHDRYPDISIIITPHDNARELEENLPAFLSQDYPGNFKVIVVAWKSDSDDEDVLKRYSSDPHLYTTYIPDSSRYMSRKKLAITIGVKAAQTEWVIMTDITSRPDSGQWLKAMAAHCNEGNRLVIGYSRYAEETSDFRQFERLVTDFYLMRETQRGRTYRCNSTCLAFRKSDFVREEGFRGNLKYLRGEYDFMANKYAQPMAVALEADPETGWMTEQEPSDKEWRNKHLFYIENRRHLTGSARHRLPIIIDQIALYINYIAIIGSAIFGFMTNRLIIVAAAALALVITLITRTAVASRAMKAWMTDIPAWKTVAYEIGLGLSWLSYKLRYMHADKNDFISHKI